jgi:dipeptidyl aminopeptidase/acylaminoacyl peptidase
MKPLLLNISFFLFFFFPLLNAQSDVKNELDELKKYNENLRHRLDQIEKSIDDILWFQRVGDIAFVDKIFMTGPPRWKEKNPDAQGAGNPVKLWSYVFIPKGINYSQKHPLIVFPHGGVHSNFSTYYTHIIRELMVQGYIVVANEYRGSTGYGKTLYENIDYGGLEIDDVDESRKYMIEAYDFVDASRVGIIGWSHGGLIALMNIFNYPEKYKAAFAGVPVSDIIARMGYKNDEYRKLFSAEHHIGQSADENVKEYRRRSPVWNAEKLKTPLLIHTNTNDEDVNVLEVEALINALKAAEKKFEYEIFKDLPGGHSFDRMDTNTALEIRVKIYRFLADYLNPDNPLKSVEQIREKVYR